MWGSVNSFAVNNQGNLPHFFCECGRGVKHIFEQKRRIFAVQMGIIGTQISCFSAKLWKRKTSFFLSPILHQLSEFQETSRLSQFSWCQVFPNFTPKRHDFTRLKTKKSRFLQIMHQNVMVSQFSCQIVKDFPVYIKTSRFYQFANQKVKVFPDCTPKCQDFTNFTSKRQDFTRLQAKKSRFYQIVHQNVKVSPILHQKVKISPNWRPKRQISPQIVHHNVVSPILHQNVKVSQFSCQNIKVFPILP